MSGTRPVIQHAGDYAVVSPIGEIDLDVRADLLEAYEDAIALMNVPHLIVDFSAVTFMDCTGLDTLAAAVNRVRERAGTVSIIGANYRIMRLIQLARLDTRITALSGSRTRFYVQAMRSGGRIEPLHVVPSDAAILSFPSRSA